MQISLHRWSIRASVALATIAAAACGGLRANVVWAQDQRAERSALSSGELSADEFKKLSKVLRLPDQPWSRIHWHSSLTEARLHAQKERKPLLIRASYGTLHGVC